MTNQFKATLLLLALSFSVNAQRTIINAGHFFDARSGKMLDKQVIIVEDGKITAVGSHPKVSKTDKVIDLSDSWVLPGLIDCHVHITTNLSYRKRDWKRIGAFWSQPFMQISLLLKVIRSMTLTQLKQSIL